MGATVIQATTERIQTKTTGLGQVGVERKVTPHRQGVVNGDEECHLSVEPGCLE